MSELLWCRVADSLPAYGQEVLVTCGKEIGHVVRDYTDKEGEHWYIVGTEFEEFRDVTHWMPLPEMPKPATTPEPRDGV